MNESRILQPQVKVTYPTSTAPQYPTSTARQYPTSTARQYPTSTARQYPKSTARQYALEQTDLLHHQPRVLNTYNT